MKSEKENLFSNFLLSRAFFEGKIRDKSIKRFSFCATRKTKKKRRLLLLPCFMSMNTYVKVSAFGFVSEYY
jgi:hypothetical protein